MGPGHTTNPWPPHDVCLPPPACTVPIQCFLIPSPVETQPKGWGWCWTSAPCEQAGSRYKCSCNHIIAYTVIVQHCRIKRFFHIKYSSQTQSLLYPLSLTLLSLLHFCSVSVPLCPLLCVPNLIDILILNYYDKKIFHLLSNLFYSEENWKLQKNHYEIFRQWSDTD